MSHGQESPSGRPFAWDLSGGQVISHIIGAKLHHPRPDLLGWTVKQHVWAMGQFVSTFVRLDRCSAVAKLGFVGDPGRGWTCSSMSTC